MEKDLVGIYETKMTNVLVLDLENYINDMIFNNIKIGEYYVIEDLHKRIIENINEGMAHFCKDFDYFAPFFTTVFKMDLGIMKFCGLYNGKLEIEEIIGKYKITYKKTGLLNIHDKVKLLNIDKFTFDRKFFGGNENISIADFISNVIKIVKNNKIENINTEIKELQEQIKILKENKKEIENI